MKTDPNQPDDPDPTQPVEVQRYGPEVQRDPAQTPWEAAPAWSTRPPQPAPPAPARRGLGAASIIAIAVVAGLLSGALSALGVATLLDDAPSTFVSGEGTTDANTVSDVTIDESSAELRSSRPFPPSRSSCASTASGSSS